MFTVTISEKNISLEKAPHMEVARILRHIADTIERNDGFPVLIRDQNRATIARLSYTGEACA